MKSIGLFWFDRDLRLHDHPALSKAARQVDELVCVYVADPRLNRSNRFVDAGLSQHRTRFLDQALADLSTKLSSMGQSLLLLSGHPEQVLATLVTQLGITHLYRSQPAGLFEARTLSTLQSRFTNLQVIETATNTLLSEDDLPFQLTALPDTFSQFRRLVEPIVINPPEASVSRLPPPPSTRPIAHTSPPTTRAASSVTLPDAIAVGGETAGLGHVLNYFAGTQALIYKEQRNDLSAWTHSTKFSLWLAQGSVSVREITDQLRRFEQRHSANESTYWILFELLWREYFFWYARAHGAKLFAFSGIKSRRPLTSAYAERFKRWTQSTTPFPLVNALMRELATTGYISNRGRQIAASCLVHELSVDWRFGAAYFEQQLIDYEVGSNWGNWQYIAGVGADARDVRRFNLDKQTQIYDPDGEYRRRWLPESEITHSPHALHSVDAADWPIA